MMFPDYMSATTEFGNKIRRLSASGKPLEEFITANIQEFKEGDARKMMLAAQKYFENENDINERIRKYINRDGVLVDAKNVSNVHLAHPFFKKLVNQKVSYLFGKEFSVNTENKKFADVLNSYFNKGFMRMLKNVGKDAVKKGLTWVQVYYNEDGILSFKRIPTEEVIPFWADADHTQLDAVIRFYNMTVYDEKGDKKEVSKIEYHTAEGVWYYQLDDKGIVEDPDAKEKVSGHFTAIETMKDEAGEEIVDEEGNTVQVEQEMLWRRVPFVAFKYNSDEISLLQWTKCLIDDYDLNSSDTSNTIQDIPNSIKVVKGYDASDKGEFTHNLAVFRTAFVAGDGDVKNVETKFDIATVDSHLNRLRSDIYEAGCGVDTQSIDLGNASGIAIKFRYSDLSMDADDLANETAAALEQLIWFIKLDAMNTNLGDFMEEDVDIIFNTDMIANEKEAVEMAKESLGIISDETVIANHPWVTNAKEEITRITKEEKIKMETEKTDPLLIDDGGGTDDNAV